MVAKLVPLASGSQGNATLVEVGPTKLLVDAGISARRLARSLRAVGVTPSSIDCMLLSHEHQDHAKGAERFSKRHAVPVACSWATLDAMDLSPMSFASWQPLEPGRVIEVGASRVDPFPVPHDAAQTVGFVIEGGGVRVGLVTDLGHATTLVVERLRGCQALLIESNHDDRMLRDGPYPWHLKQRVSGRMGHLSNVETARLLREVVDEACQVVVLAHLSESNNTPRLARQAARRALASAGRGTVEMRVAEARDPSPPVLLRKGGQATFL